VTAVQRADWNWQRYVWDDAPVSWDDKCILLCIGRYVDGKTGLTRVSAEHIAKRHKGVTSKNGIAGVAATFRRLEDAGLLVRVKPNGPRSYWRRITIPDAPQVGIDHLREAETPAEPIPQADPWQGWKPGERLGQVAWDYQVGQQRKRLGLSPAVPPGRAWPQPLPF
jgi:hypothetical protein